MRAVAGAVPALLERVPLHDAAGMGACGGALAGLAGFVAIDGELAQALAQDRAFAERDLLDRADLARRQLGSELGYGIDVLRDELLDGAAHGALRVVRRPVGHLASEDQPADDEARGNRVGKALPGIAGRHVDVSPGRAAADEGRVVDRLHDLTGPAVLELAEGRGQRPRPALDARQARLRGVGLARLAVLAAGDQPVRAILGRLQADVV